MTTDELKAAFPEGSVVLLKSGSPTMTVEWVRNDGFVSVAWFNERELMRDAFDASDLIVVHKD